MRQPSFTISYSIKNDGCLLTIPKFSGITQFSIALAVSYTVRNDLLILYIYFIYIYKISQHVYTQLTAHLNVLSDVFILLYN